MLIWKRYVKRKKEGKEVRKKTQVIRIPWNRAADADKHNFMSENVNRLDYAQLHHNGASFWKEVITEKRK